jgi:Gas vesicle protein G
LNEELYSPDKIQEELMQLQLQFELDEITEAEYNTREAELLDRLDQAREG